MTRIAVVGHVEWVDFLRVQQLPSTGQITPAQRIRVNAGGGAVVAACALARRPGVDVEFFCAVGSDELGERAVAELSARGVSVHAARRDAPTRQAITFFQGRERSIVVVGERLQPAGDDDLPWSLLSSCDGVYVTAGDLGALRAARAARALVVTPRLAERLGTLDVSVDALVYSGDDRAEVAWAAQLASAARLSVVTAGASGGTWSGASAGSWSSVPLPGPAVDAYGAGDSFAAGFTLGLAFAGGDVSDPAVVARAAAVGAECGAYAMTVAGGP